MDEYMSGRQTPQHYVLKYYKVCFPWIGCAKSIFTWFAFGMALRHELRPAPRGISKKSVESVVVVFWVGIQNEIRTEQNMAFIQIAFKKTFRAKFLVHINILDSKML